MSTIERWKTFKLKDCMTLLNGRAYNQNELLSSGKYQVIRIQNLNEGSNWYFSNLELDDEKYCKKGDLLFAWSATFGPYVWEGQKAIFHYHIWRVDVDEKVLDKDFAYFLLLQITSAIRAGAHGIAMLHFSKESMEGYEVQLPEITTQKQMARNLKNQFLEVQKAEEAANIIKTETKKLKHLVLHEYLCKLKDIKRSKIGDKASTTSGSTPSRGQKSYWEPAEIPWIKTGEIAFASITRSGEYVSSLALKECSLKLLPVNSVLIAMYGQGKTRGQSAILKVPATINQACFAILPNDTWIPEYLQLWLMYSYQELRSMSENRGGNQANLNGDLLNSFEVPTPSSDIQMEVVHKINAALNEIDKLNSAWAFKSENIKTLPNRLLEEVFNPIEYEQD